MNLLRLICLSFCVFLSARAELNPAALPNAGHRELRILSPTLLELSFVSTKEPDPAIPAEWNFVGSNYELALPGVDSFRVQAGTRSIAIARVGFKRRPLYAPLRKRDLRIGNWLFLELASPLSEGESVEVANPAGNLWSAANTPYKGAMTAQRFNPALHVSQGGYMPGETKKGFVGYYMGSLGEMPIVAGSFRIVDSATGQAVFQGMLKNRRDVGYTYSPVPYQKVFEADFSPLATAGEYRLEVPGMGVSFPFLVHSGTAALFARSYALGLYHQRCGTSNLLPHTRHEHGVCHSAPAAIPDATFATANYQLSAMSHDFANNPRHTAPQLKSVDSSLYPFVNRGFVDVSGGHHDAGDYSKYTINSAGLVHYLVFAADSLGAGDLDNLGQPESGDGKSDLLQEAKWEADFLSKMQDADGGFYFLVYPRNRAYEDDVLPDRGDPQVVFPKTTAATAAAVGALAEIGSSPRFKEQFPVEAAQYLAKARLGWTFLMQAIARHGKDGAYQKITHYGNEFMHDDELAWAAAALFAATGEAQYHAKLLEFFPDPSLKTTRRWDWWRLFEGYGCAVRAYAFAARSGRLSTLQLDTAHLAKCEAELLAAGDDIARFAEQTAYGTSFPDPSKAYRSAGWFFSLERAFEMASAHRLRPSTRYIDAILSNAAYEAGCNPINMSYITGVGWTRWRDIVHQYAMNDTRVLPPSGLPLGNIQGGFAYLENYKQELGKLCYPPDGAASAPYPFYDRFGDSFNTTTEFVVVDQARGLATLAFMLARTGDVSSPSKSVRGRIVGLPATIPAGELVTAALEADGVSLAHARITWETADQEPHIGPAFIFAPKNSGEQWIEAEALLPDGRRVFATNRFTASFPVNVAANSYKSAPSQLAADTVALYRFDQGLGDAAGRAPNLTVAGRARIDTMNLGWMQARSGGAIRFDDLGDKATVSIPSSWLFTNGVTTEIVLEAMVYVHKHKAWNRGRANMLTLTKGWNASLEYVEDVYAGAMLRGGASFGVSGALLAAEMPVQTWHHLSVSIGTNGYSARVNGKLIASAPSTELAGWGNGTASLEIGNFEGWLDEVTIRSRSAATVGSQKPGTSALFLGLDRGISGTWKSLVGKEGHIVCGDSQSLPSYVQVTYQNKLDWVWANQTHDTRGLQRAAGTNRLFATMYSFSYFDINLNFNDKLPHRVSFYCLDLTGAGRAQRMDVIDRITGAVLHSTNLANFAQGVYAIYELSGEVCIRVTNTGLNSAVVGGIFFDKGTPSSEGNAGAVTFLGRNDQRQGTWKGVVGSEGWWIPADSENLPLDATLSPRNGTLWVWSQDSSDTRAVQRASSNKRFLPALYSFGAFDFNVSFLDGKTHRVSFYCLDATNSGRAQRVEVFDAATRKLLHQQDLFNFWRGSHLEYAAKGSLIFRFTTLTTGSAVISGVFIDPY